MNDEQQQALAEAITASLPVINQSEQVVLGFLLAGGTTAELAVNLDAEDFAHLANRALYTAVKHLERQGPVDFEMLLQHLTASEDAYLFRALGGVENYLRECCCHLFTVETLPYHARQVAGKGDLRRLQLALVGLLGRLTSAAAPDDLIAEAEAIVLALPNRKRATAIESVKQVARRVLVEMESRIGGETRRGITTGFENLDDAMGGMQAKDLVIVAARPAMGKTAFAVQVADAAAEQDAALVFEFEMPSEALVKRLFSAKTSIPSEELRAGSRVTSRILSAIQARAGSMLEKSSLSFVSRSAMRISELRSVARRWRMQNSRKRGVIVVDYLQLVRPDRDAKEANEVRDVGEVSRGLKAMAVELDVTVLALAQLNRDLERRTDKRPVMADLRSSGQIEQDADVIAFLYRDEVYNKASQDRGVAEVIIGKNRNGATGTIKLAWKPIYTRFETLPGATSWVQ